MPLLAILMSPSADLTKILSQFCLFVVTSTLEILTGIHLAPFLKKNIKQHQELLDIIADHALTQLVNMPTRKDKTLDLLLTNYPSIVNNIETIQPIGEADR